MCDRLAVKDPYIVGHGWLPSMRGDIFTTSQGDFRLAEGSGFVRVLFDSSISNR